MNFNSLVQFGGITDRLLPAELEPAGGTRVVLCLLVSPVFGGNVSEIRINQVNEAVTVFQIKVVLNLQVTTCFAASAQVRILVPGCGSD